MQTLFVLCGEQVRELQYEVSVCLSVCLSVCGSVRLLAAFGSSAKLCPEHSYAPAKGTSFENGGIKRVKIRLRLSSLSSLNLWFCELVGKEQRWSKYQSVPRDSRLILQVQKTGLRVARGRLAWGIASVVIACHASLSLLQVLNLKRTKVTAVATLLQMAPAAPNSRRPGCWIWSRLQWWIDIRLKLNNTKQICILI